MYWQHQSPGYNNNIPAGDHLGTTAPGQPPPAGHAGGDLAPLQHISGVAGHHHGSRLGRDALMAGSRMECEDQECVEEECDPDECGDEKRGPADGRDKCCGLDRRPLLPVLLFVSTVIGAACMLVVQLTLLSDSVAGFVKTTFFSVYVITLVTLLYTALSDPGQLKISDQQLENAASWPKRTHKSWQYTFPIRRYDHYCRWLTNCIGLLNHREFVVMCSGLTLIGIAGGILDIVLAITEWTQTEMTWQTLAILLAHCGYSIALTTLVGPILRIHIGLVSRNELAAEWKRNDFYVVSVDGRGGQDTPVNELSDDEFNARFDSFAYDRKRNAFDRGCMGNCYGFWCIPRWKAKQMGDF